MALIVARRGGPASPAADRILAAATVALLAVLAAAILRGHAHWRTMPAAVWLHIATVVPAMALAPVLLLRRKADRLHRRLGYGWVALIAATALVSFFVRTSNPGGFSFVHLLSAWTLVMLWAIVAAARAHDMPRHRARVRGLVIGALLIAGFFTLPFGRVLGTWLTQG